MIKTVMSNSKQKFSSFPESGETLHAIKDLYLEYMENSQNTIIRKQPNEKNWAKDLSRYLTKRDIWIASKLIKRSCKSLIIVAQTTLLFSKVVIPFYILTSSVEGSNCSSPLPTLGQSFNFSHSDGYVVVSYCVFFSYKKLTFILSASAWWLITVWCHCLYYSCLGNFCLTIHYFSPNIDKLHFSIIMKIVFTSWTL